MRGETTSNSEEVLQGTVKRVTFRSAETGFGVLKLETSAREITVIGDVPPTIGPGTLIHARGIHQKHPKFGEQFRAFSITETEPTTEEGLVRYLSSGAIRTLGEVMAQRVVDVFGPETIRVLDEEPHRLTEVPGIGKRKLEEILESWQEIRRDRDSQLFFSQHGIPSGIAQRIIRRHGNRAIEIVKSNPYLLCDDVHGIGFLTADKIALALGINPFSDQRIGAALEFTLKQASEDGHTYLPEEILIEKTAKQLGCEDASIIIEPLKRVIVEGRIIREVLGGRVLLFSPQLQRAESALADHLSDLLVATVKPIQEEIVENCATKEYLGSDSKVILLSDEQRHAVHLAAKSALTVITGGPGCGKTTLVRALVTMFRRAGFIIKLAAPTGRAAQRLSEVCEHEASTIHRMLKFDPVTKEFVHNSRDPIECDVLMIDETSMLDVLLAEALLQAVPKHARVIFIGDADQLPSVGPGLFLADLLELARNSTIRLTNLFRRASESLISVAAHQINSGEVPEIPEPDGITKSDAYFLPIREAMEGAALIERVVVDQIPKKFGLKNTDITVLTPMNQGELGTSQLNRRLQEKILPTTSGVPALTVGAIEFRLGDRVCQRINNYQLSGGVFNGDQGEIIGVDQENKRLVVKLWDGREVEYPKEVLSQLDLAYALSIHRSQGSEIPAVVLALHDSHTILLERQLLYTAITRAKKLLIIVGSRKAFVMAVKRTRSRRRYSALLLRMQLR